MLKKIRNNLLPRLAQKINSGRADGWLAIIATLVIVIVGLWLGWSNVHVVIQTPEYHYMMEPGNLLNYMANYDGADYPKIATIGYTELFWVNWFPLYPMIIWLLHLLIPSALISALLIAWACLAGAIYFYIKIARHLLGTTDTESTIKALSFFVLFPTGVFLIASFAESLLAMLTLGAIYFALKRRPVPAALLAMLASASHITGIFAAVAVGLILLEEKLPAIKAIAAAAVGSLGLIGYMLFLYIKFRQPLGFLKSQVQYHEWTTSGVLNLITTATFMHVALVALVVTSVVYWWKRRRSLAVYSALFLVILLVGRQYGGFDRYVLMAFPVQWMLYEFFRRRSNVYPYALAVLAVAWTYIVLQYTGGYIGS